LGNGGIVPRILDFRRVIISRIVRLLELVVRIGEMRNGCKILFGKSEGKRPLGKPGRRWKYNIRMDLRE
jgi:hypothetical protein